LCPLGGQMLKWKVFFLQQWEREGSRDKMATWGATFPQCHQTTVPLGMSPWLTDFFPQLLEICAMDSHGAKDSLCKVTKKCSQKESDTKP
jgi:hypothetical protein